MPLISLEDPDQNAPLARQNLLLPASVQNGAELQRVIGVNGLICSERDTS